ncbi:FMN-dependent NADH-azoreductase [Streptomyces sp. SAI-135]|jgi:FMN-dependent NADH-azoreductase|uniref:FMN-dependent NADH-azoreductase n=1 Tax=unclassified Streptomyces TaxID=2593676 RepID=UPI0024765E67|nr:MULTISPECIES: NAD(P)H-dependent oxidoreductase [unclassified Streptomyces]MDH6522610.1 FMN-dependent NADH-azoreductase [Streptomyces sp. SAI-090]MDH6554233.1 FMN-dependent NADH-azoreductase [Streptomyces sp. SAI-041]MDH6573493.1 FMN-dependent NADH-azoreductase [Streptomyces sp. SAI-117]MDH6581769.1 FMN-dependent NADH-azoreductase [Streptomyces sp. SAI-133]MDH6613772.1 FMN-dependent NADH-azoreductase [Streptomyces sp. SAI-135]
MARLLYVDSSVFTEESVSKEIAKNFLDVWTQEHPGGEVVHRDLGSNPVLPVSRSAVLAEFTPADNRTPEQKEAAEKRYELMNEVLEADAFLFAVPMYNWGVPGSFKDWVDQVLVTGKTFGLDPLPLVGRPATAVLTYGGGYFPGAPNEGWDHVQPYLETLLVKALGLDVRFVVVQLTGVERMGLVDLIPQAKEFRAKGRQDAAAHAKEIAARFEEAAA